MRARRQFIAFLGGMFAWPSVAHLQPAQRVRCLGVMMQIPEDDPEAKARVNAALGALEQLGWRVGRNLRVEYRGSADASRIPSLAAELIAAAPDVILAVPTRNVQELQKQARSIPIVFVNLGDPVATRLVPNLAHPEGNITGFLGSEISIAVKWAQLLKEIAPSTNRILVLTNPVETTNQAYLKVIADASLKLGVHVSSSTIKSPEDIDRALSPFAREPHGGLVVLPGGPITVHRKLIIAAAAQHRLPAVYGYGYYAKEGGLISYGADVLDQWRRAASYVDRILRGENPANLPVQGPTTFHLVINRKTAQALGLRIPPEMLLRADAVIE